MWIFLFKFNSYITFFTKTTWIYCMFNTPLMCCSNGPTSWRRLAWQADRGQRRDGRQSTGSNTCVLPWRRTTRGACGSSVGAALASLLKQNNRKNMKTIFL